MLAYAVSVFLPGRPSVVGWVHELVPVAVPAAVAVLCARAARRLPASRAKWALFSAGAATWAAGDLAFTVLDTLEIEPAGSLTFADAGYLALVPLWCLAFILHPARAGRGFEQWGTSLDGAAAIVGAGGLVWVYVFGPVARSADNIPGVIVNLTYPVGDLALLIVFIALIPRTGLPLRKHDSLLGVGVLLFAMADMAFARLAITDSYETGSPIDLAFIAAFVAVGMGSRAELHAGRATMRTNRAAGPATGLAALALLATVGVTGLVTEHRVIVSAAMLMGLLIATRQTLLLMDRRRLNLALEVAMETAQAANQAKTEFLSHMSHELGTPLTSILGYAQLIEEGSNREESRQYAAKITAAGRHVNEIVSEALDISRIEQGRLSLSIEPVGLAGLAVECLTLMRPFAERSGIHVRIEGAEGQRFVLADRRRLKQALLNFLSNAVKYNVEGGTVTVSWRPIGHGRIRVSVTDTGPGIDPQALDRIFTPFERLGSVRKAGGTGLGLALSKRMVEAMGGVIGVDSLVGSGSTFWIDLPEASHPVLEAAPRDAETGRASGTILYIEDNHANVTLVQQLLRGRPIAVVGAMQAESGIDLAVRRKPDLILLDQHLPDLDAGAVIGRLRSSPDTRDIPIVILSADASPEGYEELLEAGARAYLTKPIDVDRFVRLIDEALAPTPDRPDEPLRARRTRTS